EEIVPLRVPLPPEVAGVRVHLAAVPLGREVRLVRRPRVADEDLTRQRVVLRVETEIGADDAIVASPVVLAARHEETGKRVLPEIVPDAADEDLRLEILVREVRAE